MDREEQQRYSTWRRPFRLQLSLNAAVDFGAPASRGRCQWSECWRFEWEAGREYCRDHWLEAYGVDQLPERAGR